MKVINCKVQGCNAERVFVELDDGSIFACSFNPDLNSMKIQLVSSDSIVSICEYNVVKNYVEEIYKGVKLTFSFDMSVKYHNSEWILERLKSRYDPRIVFPDKLAQEAAEEIEKLKERIKILELLNRKFN